MTTKKQTAAGFISDDLLRPILLALLGWLCLQSIGHGNDIAAMRQQLISIEKSVAEVVK